MALEHVLIRRTGSIDRAPIIRIEQDRLEIRITQDAHPALPRRDEHPRAAPAEADLVRLHVLLEARPGRRLGGRQHKDAVRLVADDQGLAVGRPGEREGCAETRDLVGAVLGAHVPELDGAVVADAAELGILDWVEGDFFNGREVALELG